MNAAERAAKVKPVVAYPRDAVVDYAQAAAGLGVSPEIAKKMDLPFFMAGGRERLLWGQVLDVLAERAAKHVTPLTVSHLTMMEVYDAYQRNDLDALPNASTVRPLAVAMQEWIDGLTTEGASADYSAKHVISLGTSRRYFEKARKNASIADLPDVLEQLRGSLGVKHPRSFNLARAAALAFVRATLKKSHPLWLAISAVEPRKVKATKQRRPLTVDEMREMFPARDTDNVDAIAWSMATTGMGPGEYWGSWKVLADRIHVAGTKREGRVRDVPLVLTPAVPGMIARTFQNTIRARFARSLTPYDLRRTYANWLEAAGVPRTRRKLYMGHGAGDITDLYERHEVEAFLVEDAKKLRAFVGLAESAESDASHTKTHTMRIA